MAGVERAHASLNAACNAIAMDRGELPSPHDIGLAQGYLAEARRELEACRSRGGDAAAVASRAALPRLDRALQLLGGMAVAQAPPSFLLGELGAAMDDLEAALAAVGWD